MRILTATPTSSKDLTIQPRFSPSTVLNHTRFDESLGIRVCDVLVGVVPHSRLIEPTFIETMKVTIPTARLLTGLKPDCIRTIRFNHLLNILSSWAKEVKGVDLSQDAVVFLGFA